MQETIKVWSNKENYLKNRKNFIKIFDKISKSNQLILGPQVQNFEEEFSKQTNNKFGIGVNSGTDALEIILMTLNIKSGDEVITTSNTAVPTVSAIVSCGAKPVFVDIREKDFLIDPQKIKKKISKKTKAIIAVNLYGQCVDYKEIKKITKKYNLHLIEDCAQSTGSFQEGKPSGSAGVMSAFSFYPTKNLGTFGDGGMIVTNSKKYFLRAQQLRKYGMRKQYYSNFHGINSRLDELHAAILLYKLKNFKKSILARRKIAKNYNQKIINKNLILPSENKKNYHSYYVYVVRHKKRSSFMKHLKKKKIICNISYPFPIHLMKGYKYLGYEKGDFKITERLSKEIFSLPMYPELSLKKVNYIIKVINTF
tara:strand:- start:3597 stop:4697 length:1101 start_codon:yes stop_codon:yes gene_type:complete